jgi:hypothetical protein
MASFVSANLSHELSEHFVTFTLTTVIRFEPKEVGHRWLLQYQFMEEDPMADDKLSQLRPAESIGDPNPGLKRHYIIGDRKRGGIRESGDSPPGGTSRLRVWQDPNEHYDRRRLAWFAPRQEGQLPPDRTSAGGGAGLGTRPDEARETAGSARETRAQPAVFSYPPGKCTGQGALTTLPDLMQRLQTRTRFTSPLSSTRTR